MSAEMAITMGQLQELVDTVQKTQRSRTLKLADGVVAVVKPEKHPGTGRTPRRKADESTLPTTYTLESAFGSVPIPAHLRGKDIEEIIQGAKEDQAERIMRD